MKHTRLTISVLTPLHGLPHIEQQGGGAKADHGGLNRHIRKRRQMSQVLLKVADQRKALAKVIRTASILHPALSLVQLVLATFNACQSLPWIKVAPAEIILNMGLTLTTHQKNTGSFFFKVWVDLIKRQFWCAQLDVNWISQIFIYQWLFTWCWLI